MLLTTRCGRDSCACFTNVYPILGGYGLMNKLIILCKYPLFSGYLQIILSIICVFACNATMAQTATYSAKIYFNHGDSRFEPGLNDNRRVMQKLLKEVKRQNKCGNIERLRIRAYTTPDEFGSGMKPLSGKRCDELVAHIVSQTGIDARLIDTSTEWTDRIGQDGEMCPDAIIYLYLKDPIASIISGYDPATQYHFLSDKPASRFALKVNVLYAALLLPSIEFECRLGKRWSIGLEGNMAWWKKREQHKCYQLAIVSPNLRMWFKGNSLNRGLYVGIFGGAGLYDLENVTRGYRGEGVMAGVGIGYMFPFGKAFAIEAEAGGGWLLTRYKEYRPFEGHHIYIRQQNTNYFGPLKLKLAFVWRFGKVKNKKGGER